MANAKSASAINTLKQAYLKSGEKDKKVADTIDHISSCLVLLNSSSPSNQSLNKLNTILRTPMIPLYNKFPDPALQFSAAVYTDIINDKIKLMTENDDKERRRSWESVQAGILSGVLDYLETCGDDGKEAVASAFYQILCDFYIPSSSQIPETGVKLATTVYTVLSESAAQSASNQRKLRDPQVLGGTRLGAAMSQSFEYLSLECLLSVFVRLLPSVNGSTLGRLKRTQFIREVFVLSEAFKYSEELVQTLEAVSTVDWESVAAKLLDIFAKGNIKFPQPFSLNEFRACGTTFPQSAPLERLFLNTTGFLANIVDEDDAYDSFNCLYSSLKQIIASPSSHIAGQTNIVMHLLPPFPVVSDKEYRPPPGQIATMDFILQIADVDRFFAVLRSRGLGDSVLSNKIKPRKSLQRVSIVQSPARLSRDSNGFLAESLTFETKVSKVERLYQTHLPSNDEVEVTEPASAEQLFGRARRTADAQSDPVAEVLPNPGNNTKPTRSRNISFARKSLAAPSISVPTTRKVSSAFVALDPGTSPQAIQDAVFGAQDEESSEISDEDAFETPHSLAANTATLPASPKDTSRSVGNVTSSGTASFVVKSRRVIESEDEDALDALRQKFSQKKPKKKRAVYEDKTENNSEDDILPLMPIAKPSLLPKDVTDTTGNFIDGPGTSSNGRSRNSPDFKVACFKEIDASLPILSNGITASKSTSRVPTGPGDTTVSEPSVPPTSKKPAPKLRTGAHADTDDVRERTHDMTTSSKAALPRTLATKAGFASSTTPGDPSLSGNANATTGTIGGSARIVKEQQSSAQAFVEIPPKRQTRKYVKREVVALVSEAKPQEVANKKRKRDHQDQSDSAAVEKSDDVDSGLPPLKRFRSTQLDTKKAALGQGASGFFSRSTKKPKSTKKYGRKGRTSSPIPPGVPYVDYDEVPIELPTAQEEHPPSRPPCGRPKKNKNVLGTKDERASKAPRITRASAMRATVLGRDSVASPTVTIPPSTAELKGGSNTLPPRHSARANVSQIQQPRVTSAADEQRGAGANVQLENNDLFGADADRVLKPGKGTSPSWKKVTDSDFSERDRLRLRVKENKPQNKPQANSEESSDPIQDIQDGETSNDTSINIALNPEDDFTVPDFEDIQIHDYFLPTKLGTLSGSPDNTSTPRQDAVMVDVISRKLPEDRSQTHNMTTIADETFDDDIFGLDVRPHVAAYNSPVKVPFTYTTQDDTTLSNRPDTPAPSEKPKSPLPHSAGVFTNESHSAGTKASIVPTSRGYHLMKSPLKNDNIRTNLGRKILNKSESSADVINVLNEIHEVIIDKIHSRFESVKSKARSDRDVILQEAITDLRAMHAESEIHCDGLITLEQQYAEHNRRFIAGFDDVIKVNDEISERIHNIIEDHDRNSLSKRMPNSLFSTPLPAVFQTPSIHFKL